jgi:hypothetical protein
MKEKAAISTQAQTAATNGQLMTKNAFVVTVKCGSSRFCLVSADAREACIEAEHYIRNVFGLAHWFLRFRELLPRPRESFAITYQTYVEILTDHILQRKDLTTRSARA